MLMDKFPALAKKVEALPETAYIIEVSKAFNTKPQPNPSDWAVAIMGLIQNGATPSDGSGAGSSKEKDTGSRTTGI